VIVQALKYILGLRPDFYELLDIENFKPTKKKLLKNFFPEYYPMDGSTPATER